VVDKPVLLAVLAHPDDESFGIGGTLAKYAEKEIQVHLVCATRGEAGTVAPRYLEGYGSIADRRVSELRCAAGILGLSDVYFLDYRDSGMTGSEDNKHPQALMNAPLEEVTGKVISFIRRLRPQVVITSDPIGGYMHPDHIAIQRATTKAFEVSGDPSYKDPDGLPPHRAQKLYYHLIPKQLMRLGVRLLPLFGRDPHKFGQNGDIDLAALVEQGNFPIHTWIDCKLVVEKRNAAAACHASQLEGDLPKRGPVAWVLRWIERYEQYMRAYPPVNGRHKESDLFEGIS
jgi:N-acetyl-1-D-myo-inositol-2-amino-2-deoxy-alpha-D-glucopyranoside deacetylase